MSQDEFEELTERKRPMVLPLALGLIIGSAGLTYATLRFSRESPPENRAISMNEGAKSPKVVTKQPVVPVTLVAPPPVEEEAEEEVGQAETKGGAPQNGAPPADPKATTIMKMEPIVVNLDEGEQLRYLKVAMQLEVSNENQPRIMANMPRARHEALMYMSGLHVSDTQGLLGKQRIHRELQRRIADAVGGGVKRVYIDEFVVQ